MSSVRNLLNIKDPSQFFAEKEKFFSERREEMSRRYAEGNLVTREEGQWTINLGTEPSFDEAFGPPTPEEIHANIESPLSGIIAGLVAHAPGE